MNIDLKEKSCFVFDMDGTIYLGDKLIDGAAELFQYFIDEGISYFFLTNNSTKSVKDYITKLNNLGIDSDESNVITSSIATIRYIEKSFDVKNSYFFLIGTPSMEEEFRNAGISFVTKKNDNISVEAVIVGFDTTLTYQKLTDASYYLKRTNLLIATNCDYACPLPGGEVTPDCGAIVSLLEKTIDCSIMFCGKPSLAILEPIFNKGFKHDEMIIVGDRLYTDIALGFENGIDTALVFTGEATRETLIDSDVKPVLAMKSIKEIYEVLKGE